MKILANDGLDNKAIEELKKIDIDTNHYENDQLVEVLKNCEIVVVRSATKITKQILERVKNTKLKLIIRAGVGLDNIDVEYAKNNGFEVRNTPNSNANSVAEFVIGAIFCLARYFPIANMMCKQGNWNKKKYQGVEIKGKNLAILGMGNIGRLIANKAKSLGMNIIFYDKYIKECEDYKYVEFEELFKKADFLTINIPLIRENFISDNELKLMKKTAYIINTSRGDNLDEKAVIKAIDNEVIAGCLIDVYKNEPNIDEQLRKNDKVYLTPHIAGSTKQAQENIGFEIIEIVKEFIKK